MRRILSRLFSRDNSLDTRGLSPESLQMMLDNSFSMGLAEGKRTLITSWKPHTHLVIFSSFSHYSFEVRRFCDFNRLSFNRACKTAECKDTGDKYYFYVVEREQDVYNLAGLCVQNIIWMDKPISEYVRCFARSRLRNR